MIFVNHFVDFPGDPGISTKTKDMKLIFGNNLKKEIGTELN